MGTLPSAMPITGCAISWTCRTLSLISTILKMFPTARCGANTTSLPIPAPCETARVTRPGYEENLDKKYPVLYLLHGGGENETGWIWQGKINLIMDNLLAEGNCKEMIVVMNFGHAYAPGTQQAGVCPDRSISCLSRTAFHFIEGRFRTFKDKAHRAIHRTFHRDLQTQWTAFNNLTILIISGSSAYSGQRLPQ